MLGVLFAWVLLLLSRSCVRVVFRGNAFAGIQPRAIVISVGVTAVIFSGTVNALVKSALSIIIAGFQMVTETLQMVLVWKGGDFDGLLQTIADRMSNEFSTLSNLLYRFVYDVSFSSVLAAVATCLVIAIIVNGSESSISPIKQWCKSLSPKAQKKIIIAVALAFGGYLSLASIIAIPWIQGINNTDPKEINELRSEILASIATDAEIEAKWPTELTIDLSRFEELDSLLSEQKESSTDSTILNKIKEEIDAVRSDSESLKQGWLALRDRAIRSHSMMTKSATDSFDTYIKTDLSVRERAEFQDDIIRWYRSSVPYLDEELRNYRRYVEWTVRDWKSWANWVIENFNDLKQNQNAYLLSVGSIENLKDFNRGLGRIEASSAPSPRESIGLGVFGFFANWLVENRSFSLALISGMIGFGLFGSVMARALIPYSPNVEGQLDRDSLDVLLVGSSASVIIFLASQGGLAIIGTGDIQPNAYILFLACFVGAAYGDQVWNTAKIRLAASLKSRETDPGI